MKHAILAAFAAFTLSASASDPEKWAEWGPQHDHGIEYVARIGYTIGGTTPLPVPNEIRGIKSFSPKGGGMVALDLRRMFTRKLGLSTGLHLFHEGFHTEADVKGYKMSITVDGNSMSGYFTGRDVTNTELIGMSIPLLMTIRTSPRWNISFGPYFATYFKGTFDGEVYDNDEGVGYLRVDTPTGEKVTMDRTTPATYDFAEEVRSWGAGLELCFDWKATHHLNVFGNLDWGLSDAINPDFTAVEFKMYPIYATLGVGYRF